MTLPRAKGYVSGLRPTEQRGMNPKESLGMLKVPLGLISPTACVVQAHCMQDGAEKYGPYNWRHTPIQALIYLEACYRHLYAIMDGEDYDPKTGKPHIGYALATLQIYADAWINGHLVDNRPLPGRGGNLLELLAQDGNNDGRTPEETLQLWKRFIARVGPNPQREQVLHEAGTQKGKRNAKSRKKS